jgi:hypothetical protein
MEKPRKIRLEVSFVLPEDMGKKDAQDIVYSALRHWIAANPSRQVDPGTLKVARFTV